MTKASGLFALALLIAGPARAQFNDGVDDSVRERRAENLDQRRAVCRGPACRNDPQGIYPQSTSPGEGAKTPSMSGGFVQH